MLRSMTGYGKGEVAYGRGRIVVEIRSVNHRYCEISTRLPRNLVSLETDIKKYVSERLKRGKVEVHVQHEVIAGASPLLVNIPLAKAYRDAFQSLKTELGLADEVSLPLIAAQKDVLSSFENNDVDETLREALLGAVEAGVRTLDAMRVREGDALADDLRMRRGMIAQVTGNISKRAPAVVSEYSERLKSRLLQMGVDQSIDAGRFAQEVAIMADRSDITEELVRLDSHLRQFDDALALGEPVGRKLDFLLQEMGREVNTIGAKANDAEIASYVVDLKTEIEKIREQVQNIE